MAHSTYNHNNEPRTLDFREENSQERTVAERVNENRQRIEKLEMELEKINGKREDAESYARAMAEERAHIARERDAAIHCRLEGEERHRKQVQLAVIRAEEDRAALEEDYQERLRKAHEAHEKTAIAWERKIKELEVENARLKTENAFLRETIFATCPVPTEEVLLECFSCKREYSTDATETDGCAFHPLPPVSSSVWSRWQDEFVSRYRNSEYGLYNYWPCCNILSPKARRPVGCRRGQHHQKWEMDIMMKRVMLSPDILEEIDEFQEPAIVN